MDPRFRTHYLPDGQAPKAGARMAFPKLAKTLRQVARLGRDGFYEGWIAEDLCATLNQQNKKSVLFGVHVASLFC